MSDKSDDSSVADDRLGVTDTSGDRQSFNRFDDHFLERLIRYLSFEDKFRTECLSKRWQRLVLNGQKELIISQLNVKIDANNDLANLAAIAAITKKCPNITKVVIDCDSDPLLYKEIALNLIDNLEDITHITFEHFLDIDDPTLDKFFAKYGSSLTSIWMTNETSLFDTILFFTQYAKHCPNLIEYRASNLFFRFAEFMISNKSIAYLPDLKRVEYLQFVEEDRLLFKNFVDTHKSLEIVKVLATSLSTQLSLNYLMFSLSRLKRLKTLSLYIQPLVTNDHNLRMDSLKVIGICSPVKALVINFMSEPETIDISVETLDSIVTALKFFPQLKRLAIFANLADNTDYDLKSESFKDLKLTHLTLRFIGLTAEDNFFANIDKHLPDIRYVYISVNKVTPLMIEKIKKLKHLKQSLFFVKHSDDSNAEHEICVKHNHS